MVCRRHSGEEHVSDERGRRTYYAEILRRFLKNGVVRASITHELRQLLRQLRQI
jgi:hypothetical protein